MPLIKAPARPFSEPLVSAFWMIVSCALLAGLSALARYLAIDGMHPFQIVFFRLLFGVVAISPLLLSRGLAFAKTRQPGLYLIRVALSLITIMTWFWALAYAPLGEITAISFLVPILATIGAALFLGETVRLRRWTATLVGFAGVLIILRPGMVDMGLGKWLALLSAIAMGISTLFIKRLTRFDDPDKIVFISASLMTPVALVPALFVWQWPEPAQWPLLALMGAVATLGHITLTRALAASDASYVVSFDFARLPFAVLLGYVLFDEITDLWTWVGAGVIFAATVYITRREAQLKRAVDGAGRSTDTSGS
ncbi:MAG: DMT family transporter [Hyphomicrobiales bacterium]|nr:DMT family transporter [Hyphomicrobiales bacterium]